MNSALKNLLDRGLIEKTWRPERPPECTIKLTYDGILELAQAEANRPSADLQVDQKKHRCNKPGDWKKIIKKIGATIIGVVGFIASAIAINEYFGG